MRWVHVFDRVLCAWRWVWTARHFLTFNGVGRCFVAGVMLPALPHGDTPAYAPTEPAPGYVQPHTPPGSGDVLMPPVPNAYPAILPGVPCCAVIIPIPSGYSPPLEQPLIQIGPAVHPGLDYQPPAAPVPEPGSTGVFALGVIWVILAAASGSPKKNFEN